MNTQHIYAINDKLSGYTALLGLGSIANGSSGYSNAFDLSLGESTNESWENGFGESISGNYSDSFSNAQGIGESWNYGENGSNNSSYDAVYGSEASARDNMGASTPAAAVASSGLANASKAQTFADQRGASQGSSYGYTSGGSYQKYSSQSRSHSEGYSKSHNENHGGSKGKSSNFGMGSSHSEHTNNLQKALNGLGDFFNGLSSGMKTGKGWDGYDMPLNY